MMERRRVESSRPRAAPLPTPSLWKAQRRDQMLYQTLCTFRIFGLLRTDVAKGLGGIGMCFQSTRPRAGTTS